MSLSHVGRRPLARPVSRPVAAVRPSPVQPAVRPAVKAAAQAQAQPQLQPAEGTFERLGRWLDGLFQPDEPAPKPKPKRDDKTATAPDPAPAPDQPAPAPVPAPALPPAVDMPILTRGDSGELVLFLQKRLGKAGFPLSATPNGVFGPATEAAVRAFQAANGIPTTGNVGPLTWAALGVQHHPAIPKRAPKLNVAATAEALGVDVENFKRNWPYLAKALTKAGLTDKPSVIAALATIRIEAPGFEPIHEYGGPSYWARYNDRTDLGNRVGTDDGVVYHGRGYIQLTGRANYITYGSALGVDLVGQPDLALAPDVAASVLVSYFQRRGIPSMARRGDWQGVRRAVNGGLNGWDVFSRYVTTLQTRPGLFRK